MAFKTDDWPTREDEVLRSMPHAVGPEKSLLSSILQNPQEFIPLAIEELITERHFYLPAHATLYSFLLELYAAGKEIELVSLVQKLLDRGILDAVGGPSAVTDLYTYAPTGGHFRVHLELVRDKFAAREIIRISNESIKEVYDSPEEIPATLERMEREIMAIRDIEAADKPETMRQSVAVVLDKFEAQLKHDPKSKGISTGYEEIDRMTNGLCAPDMFVIGARPSVGKTSLMMNIVEYACIDQERPTLVFSAEMSHEAITRRMLFSRARFALSKVSRGHVPDKGELQRIQRAALEVAGCKLFVDPKSGPTISYICAKARRMKREHDIELIAIDYLGLIKSLSKQSQFSREREISEISAGIKGLGKDLNVPIILLAQLNREVEKRTGGKESKSAKPRMSDLKDSGSIEADADIIGLLSRDAYQASKDDASDSKPTGASTLDLVKNRNGPTGPVHLDFIDDLMRFESAQPRQQELPPPPEPPKRGNRYGQ